jgi:CubicO group peptidase (beta-lactamase class C family)
MHGHVHPDFAPVARTFGRIMSGRGPRGGAAVAVYHRGQLVVDIWAGAAATDGSPWERDTMAMSFSTTKGVVATVVHRLVDRGELSYDDPVALYWPEFKAAGKDNISIRHLLTHQAGLHPIHSLVDTTEELLDWDHMVQLLAAEEPAWAPEAHIGYHALTYGWLVGEVIRQVTGLTVHDAVQQEVAEPLGLDSFYIGTPPEAFARTAHLLIDPSVSDRLRRLFDVMDRFPPTRPAVEALLVDDFLDVASTGRIHEGELPAANGVFTARDLARLYAALATPGAFDGPALLSPATLAEATRIQTRGRDVVIGIDMRWRLGYHMAATNIGILPRGFGHFGFGGSGAWGDPDTGLAVAMVLNRVTGTLFGDTRFLRVGGAAVRSARKRPGG